MKLGEGRVDALIAGGTAHAVAPAGRPFREWAAVPLDHAGDWPDLLDETLTPAARRD